MLAAADRAAMVFLVERTPVAEALGGLPEHLLVAAVAAAAATSGNTRKVAMPLRMEEPLALGGTADMADTAVLARDWSQFAHRH